MSINATENMEARAKSKQEKNEYYRYKNDIRHERENKIGGKRK